MKENNAPMFGETVKTPASGPALDATAASLDTTEKAAPTNVVKQQLEVRDQIRYVREFLSNPMFFDMGGAKISTSSSQDEIDQHRSDLTYKVNVLKAILALHEEELLGLDRLAPAETTPDATIKPAVKTPVKKTGPKKAGPKKSGPNKTGPNKTGPNKTGPKKTGPKKTGPKKTGPKKTGANKTGPKKSASKPAKTQPSKSSS